MTSLRRVARGAVLAAVALLAAACASIPDEGPRKPRELPVFPPPPAPPRFHFERAIYSSADILAEEEGGTLRRMLTGETRVGEGLDKPYGVAVRRGRLYVTDTVRRVVHVLDIGRQRYSVIGNSDPGGLRMPFGVDIDGAGNVYVCDGQLKRVHVYDAAGKFLRELGSPEHLQRPSGIGVDRSGERVYVVDTGGVDTEKHRVVVFSGKTGEHLFEFGKRGEGPGEFNLPRDVAVAPGGELFVVDGGNFRVQVFDRDGKFQRQFGSVGRQGGQFSRPKELAIDAEGYVYVIDTAFGNFQIFNPDGELLLDVGGRSQSDAPAKYLLPSGIAVDSDGRVYVVDQFFRKVEVFRPASLAADAGHIGTKTIAERAAAAGKK